MKLFICSICFLPLTLLSQLTGSLSSDVSMCVGDGGYTITFTGGNGTMPYTFTYNINGDSPQTVTTVVGNNVSLSIPTNVAGLFNYQLTLVEDDIGTSQVLFDQANAEINALPLVNAGVDQTVCFGTSVSINGSGAITYEWNDTIFNGVPFVPVETTTYTVTGTINKGCTNTDQVTITVNPIPIVDAGPDQWICPGFSTILSGTGASTYSWNNGAINDVSFTPFFTNVYTVTGTSEYGCINTDQVTVYSECAGIIENELLKIICYPNPTSSILTIESESIIETISIYTLNGHLVKCLTPYSQKSIIDLSNLTQGVYLVELNSEKGRIVKRIIVE